MTIDRRRTHWNFVNQYDVEISTEGHLRIFAPSPEASDPNEIDDEFDISVLSITGVRKFWWGAESACFLAELDDLTYIFVYNEIFKFRACSLIVHFEAPIIGNDPPDVCYPWARDNLGQTYILTDGYCVLGNQTPFDYEKDKDLPWNNSVYDWYYENRSISNFQNHLNLAGIVLNDKLHVACKPCYWVRFPQEQWGQLKPSSDAGQVRFKDKKGELREMSYEEYVQLLDQFAQDRGWIGLDMEIICR